MSVSALAQEARTEPAAEAPDSEILVTGSRVIANGNNSPSPVTVVSTETLLTTQPGANLADALNVLPVFSGSRGAGSNPTSSGSASGGNGSANQLNLRNIGINRTLVLMDGLRIPPTLFNSAVDVDLVPQMFVKRVDIVTGGVSAVYGSDAVSGVVNYVLDKSFTGLRAEGSIGISNYSDAQTYDAGIAYGAQVSDSLHFQASYQYHDFKGILRRSDRPWMNQWGATGAGTSGAVGSETNPYINVSNIRQAAYPFGGLITSGALAGQVFRSGGTLSPFVHGESTGNAALEIGGDGGYYDSSLLQPLKAHQVFARADFEGSDTLRAYVQFAGNFKTNRNYQDYPLHNNITLSSTNPFLAPEYQAALAAAGQSTFRMRQMFDQSPRISGLAKSNQWVASAGLAGDIGAWDWGLDYVHGRSVLDTTIRNNPNRQRLAAALDAVVDPATGNIVCNAALLDPANYGDCVPLNVFGPDAASAEAIAYVNGTTHYRAVTTTDDVTGHVSGSPFSTWAGPVNFALSGEWRKISFHATSDAGPDDLVDCTNLRFNCSPTASMFQLTLPSEPGSSQTVWEVAGEFNAPLLEDSPIARSFNINGAARYTHYNTSGNYVTWKVGFDWHLTDNLRFRGTRSRDIRAPTLYDLYSERSVVLVTATDGLTGVSVQIPSINGGNPDLKAEIGNTLTGGVVWEPVRGLSIALDAYQMEITDAIMSVNGGEQGFQNACYESGGTSPYCLLQERPGSFTDTSPSNTWTAVYNQLFNIASVETWGADLELNYNGSLFNRPMNFRLLGAWQPHLYFKQPGVATRDQAGAAFGPIGFAATPTVRLTAFLRFKPTDNLTIDLLERWRNSMKISGEEGQFWVNNKVSAFGTTSVTLTYDVPRTIGDFQFFVNVQNIFNAHPDGSAYYGNGTRAGLRDGYPAGDDVRGRYYTTGVRMKF